MKLEVTKEKVLEAASKCSVAKDALKTLFPEAFVEDEKPVFSGQRNEKHFDTDKLSVFGKNLMVQIRNNGNYSGKGIYLGTDNGRIEWILTRDDLGVLVLVPTLKKN